MNKSLVLRGKSFSPALFLAPMAGITNSAFRRLIAKFGGCGGNFTEMLSPRALMREDLDNSPFTKRRAEEGPVIYQMLLTGDEEASAVVDRLRTRNPDGIDINLGCPAPEIQKQFAGAALFRDFDKMRKTVSAFRKAHDGILSIKCRLGDDPENWRSGFFERLKFFEDAGVDFVTVHPRFSNEKLKRKARWNLFPEICAATKLPIVGNGDICNPLDLSDNAESFAPLAGIMIGRVAAVKPWIFADFAGITSENRDYLAIWRQMLAFVNEDFPPGKGIGRMKEFTGYFAKNFFFGHELARLSASAPNLVELEKRCVGFLEKNPQVALGRGLSFV